MKKTNKKLLVVSIPGWFGLGSYKSAVLVALIGVALPPPAAAVPSLAIADFSFVDTSGEAHDQAAVHTQRLAAFMQALRRDVSSSGAMRLVSIDCGRSTCTSESANIVSGARAGGADFLLLGGLHKMSTLVQWMKVKLIAFPAGKALLNKTYSFRGDNDLAWQKAESYVAADVCAQLPR